MIESKFSMDVNLFVNDDERNSNIVNFCLQSKKLKFMFHELSNVKLFNNQKKLVILKENFLKEEFKRKLKSNISFFSIDTIFFLRKRHNITSLDLNIDIVIYYPVKIINFENGVLNIFKRPKIIFKNLELRNDSTLFNSENKKLTYLTEIESKITSLLFENKIVDKKVLNKKVLNQSVLIESKSLDSHLYRLRKKLISVDSKKKIVLVKNQGLKII